MRLVSSRTLHTSSIILIVKWLPINLNTLSSDSSQPANPEASIKIFGTPSTARFIFLVPSCRRVPLVPAGRCDHFADRTDDPLPNAIHHRGCGDPGWSARYGSEQLVQFAGMFTVLRRSELLHLWARFTTLVSASSRHSSAGRSEEDKSG